MPKRMRAVVKTDAARGAELQDVDVPTLGPREVLIQIKAASICGTDVHIYQWDPWAQSRLKLPLIFGHEFCGTVVEVGSLVGDLHPGDFVSAESHIVDNTCLPCRTGQKHVCQNVRIIGVDRAGSFAEYVVIPAENAYSNAPDLPPEIATLKEPFGNAVHTVTAHDVRDKVVLITGCGPIGLMAIAIARALGAARVYATELNPARLDLARRMGATRAFHPREAAEIIHNETRGEGVDVLLEMSGSSAAYREGFALLKNGGRVALLGLPRQPFEFDFTDQIIFKGITLYGVFGRRIPETWAQVNALLDTSRVDLSPLVTHRFRLEQFEEAMETMVSGTSGKVVLFP